MSTLGIVLLLAGAALAVAEAHVVSHGALGSAAVAALVAGMALVVAGAGVGAAVAVAAGAGAGAVGAGFLWLVLRKALAARRIAVRSGREGLVGRVGVVRSVPDPLGQVLLDGALWRARRWGFEPERALSCGDAIVVERVDGLTLTVRPAEEWELVP